ncbi:hypothetical protein BDN71DRAFT_1430370 [Pleurotus eryngii]|uniref:Uncharacterized protein n=1 Tax=Pleurotus eryngii TaxID=5323 RepID=A0A9P5ZYA7_PLEER|nr:hypothetical protein BDN71DRAFT_1430370 [Pleurotus eryngii]
MDVTGREEVSRSKRLCGICLAHACILFFTLHASFYWVVLVSSEYHWTERSASGNGSRSRSNGEIDPREEEQTYRSYWERGTHAIRQSLLLPAESCYHFIYRTYDYQHGDSPKAQGADDDGLIDSNTLSPLEGELAVIVYAARCSNETYAGRVGDVGFWILVPHTFTQTKPYVLKIQIGRCGILVNAGWDGMVRGGVM